MKYEITPNIEKEKEIKNNNKYKENTHKKTNPFIVIIIILIVFGIIFGSICIFGRKKTTSEDITMIDIKSDLLEYSITFNPQKNIDDLQLKIDFYNTKNINITTIYKNIGNIKKRNIYTITIPTSELSFNEMIENQYVSVSVSKGRTHLI